MLGIKNSQHLDLRKHSRMTEANKDDKMLKPVIKLYKMSFILLIYERSNKSIKYTCLIYVNNSSTTITLYEN